MSASSNIVLMLLVTLIIVFLVNTIHTAKNNNKSSYKVYHKKDIVHDLTSFESNDSISHMNSNFVDIQFHNDYRDVITALNNLVPDKRQRFNVANIPLAYSEPGNDEVRTMVNDFVFVLNENLCSEVPMFRNKNSGWDEAVMDPTVNETGWEKMRKELGLADSLYSKPKGKNIVKLIHIKNVQKRETDDEISYNVELVLQKHNVKDQVIIKAGFLQDKTTLNDENNFFVSKTIDMKVIIEDIYIVGYLSRDGLFNSESNEIKYLDYDKMEHNELVDPKKIQKILMEKYKQRTVEMNHFNAMLDEEGQDFHRTLPHLYDYENVKKTRTIFDDMNKKKVFY